MVADFQISGADQFLALSKALKNAGQLEMRKELHKGMKEAVKPLIPEVRKAAKRELPHRGGLADAVAKRPIRAVVRTGEKNPGVSLQISKTQKGYLDGVIRKPTFERDKSSRKGKAERIRQGSGEKHTHWGAQQVGPGHWFDDTIRENADMVLPELEAAIQRVFTEIVRRAEAHG